MKIIFDKYEGTGNDFILIDNRANLFDRKNNFLVAQLCNRKFGIGADGLMLLQNKANFDFEMVYYNADGNESSMCGNGGRCISAFAKRLELVKEKANFYAIDGKHESIISEKTIRLKMNDVSHIDENEKYYFIQTGSPHYVEFIDDVENFNVFENGKNIRNSDAFKKEGTNVNFIEKQNQELFVRTYERGVENETLSCGTGVTAAALVAAQKNIFSATDYCDVKTLGGKLRVYYKKNNDNSFTDIWLEGAATFVFKGEIDV
ncbi:MAG TPA: diaminopimelate epimerase [Bacteroidia bacterium]|nr:diaminopimelate epimerase [Bacteroidia bacterium]